MPFLFVVLYGLFSGFFDVLPVSSSAHQAVFQKLFGVNGPMHLYHLFIHLASLFALILASMPSITALLREQRILSQPRKRMQGDRKFTYELRFVKTAAISAAVFTALMMLVGGFSNNLLVMGIFCVVNGAIVLVPEYLPYGNKTAKHMNRLDASVFGLVSGLSAFSGVSRIATMQFYGSMRGADRTKVCNWALLATIPALVVLSLVDLFGLFTDGAGTVTFLTFLSYLFGAALSFVGTFSGVTFLRFLSAKIGFTGFGYNSIGAGIFTFFLYLTV